MDPTLAIGAALLAIAAVYALAMTAIGKLARTGGLLHGRFDFRAGSHGAAGFCIVGVFACSGLLTLSDSWRNPNALGVALLAVSVGCAIGMVSWGVICRTSEDDTNVDAPKEKIVRQETTE